MYHTIFVSNVETGESKQITDGLADSVWPAWDASGKYLWFLASTDFGLRSQWLDMTSYDHDENFALYLAVLKKGEPSPLLPESDEDKGVGSAPSFPGGGGGRGARGGAVPGAAPDASAAVDQTEQPSQAPRAPRTPITVQIDFDGLHQRIISVPSVPERQYSQLRTGAAGTVYYLEAAAAGRGRGGSRRRGGRQRSAPVPFERSSSIVVRHRCSRLRRERGRSQAAIPHCRRLWRRTRSRRGRRPTACSSTLPR